MTTPRPVTDFVCYNNTGGEAFLGHDTMYGKVQQVVTPEVEDVFREIPVPGGTDKYLMNHNLGTLAVTLTDYSIMPERLADGKIRLFETVALMPKSTEGDGRDMDAFDRIKAQFKGFVRVPNRGTLSIDPGTPTFTVVTIELLGIWYKRLGDDINFGSETSPTEAVDILRIEPRLGYFWVNGKDMRSARLAVLKG